MRIRSVPSLTLITAVALAVDAKESGTNGVVKVRGSLPLADVVERLGTSFAREHPGSAVLVSGGGLRAGLKALSESRTDIVMGSRKALLVETAVITQEDFQLEERLIGSAAITVFVNPALPVQQLTVEQLKKIYKGEIDRWSEIGGPNVTVEPYSLQDSPRGPAGWFRTQVMECAEFGPRTEFFNDPRDVIKGVTAASAGIGYTDRLCCLQCSRGKRMSR